MVDMGRSHCRNTAITFKYIWNQKNTHSDPHDEQAQYIELQPSLLKLPWHSFHQVTGVFKFRRPFRAYGKESDELYRMAAEAWPEYHLLIRVLKAMNPEDVKQMIKDITKYISQRNWQQPFTTEGLLEAMKPSMAKITESTRGLMGEMRQWFAPE